MVTSRAMQRREKVADRAGTLVTERVRAVIETAQARAERVRRDAADETHRLDSRRMQAASRIVSQIEDLESTLGRLRQKMQAEHAAAGSYVDEDRLIGAAQDGEDDESSEESLPATATFTTVTAKVEEPTAEKAAEEAADEEQPAEELADEEQPVDAEEPAPATTEATARTKTTERTRPAGVAGDSEAEDDTQRSRFSFLRRRESQEASGETSTPAEEAEQDQEHTHACAVCDRGFAGDEDELKSLGWVVSASGEVTCADCHSAGWLRPSG